MDKEQSSSRDNFVLIRLERLKLQCLQQGAQPFRPNNYAAMLLTWTACWNVTQQYYLAEWRHANSPYLRNVRKRRVRQKLVGHRAVNMGKDRPGQAWVNVTLWEPIPVSSEPSQTSHHSKCTTATETKSVKEEGPVCKDMTQDRHDMTSDYELLTNLICVLGSNDLI